MTSVLQTGELMVLETRYFLSRELILPFAEIKQQHMLLAHQHIESSG